MGVRFSFAELDCFVAALDTEYMQLAKIPGVTSLRRMVVEPRTRPTS